MKQQLHFTINQKGGCGKTHLSFLLLSWAKKHGISSIGIDTDPNNSSLADYQGLPVKTIEIMDEEGLEILPQKWDSLIYYLLDESKEDIVVIDVGATAFGSIISYLVTSNIFTEILNEKFEIYLNIPVVGGEALYDTLNGMHHLVTLFGKDSNIILWENEYFGKVVDEKDRGLEELDIYLEVKKDIDGLIQIKKMHLLHELAIEKMKKSKLTYDEVLLDKDFKLLEKSRINMVLKSSFEAMDMIFEKPVLEEGV